MKELAQRRVVTFCCCTRARSARPVIKNRTVRQRGDDDIAPESGREREEGRGTGAASVYASAGVRDPCTDGKERTRLVFRGQCYTARRCCQVSPRTPRLFVTIASPIYLNRRSNLNPQGVRRVSDRRYSLIFRSVNAN